MNNLNIEDDNTTIAETKTLNSNIESQPKKEYQSLYKRTNFIDESQDVKINEIEKVILQKKDEPVKNISLNEEELKKKNFYFNR